MPASRQTNVCPLCGLKGHKTARSKKCLHNPSNPQYNSVATLPTVPTLPVATLPTSNPPAMLGSNQQAEQPSQQQQELDMNAEDVDNMDSVPFDDEMENENLESEFHDCGTWSEDDDGEILPKGII